MLWVNVFWVDGLLIDTGCVRTLPELLGALAREGLRVEQLVNTHTDEDHVAGNAEVSRRYGVTPNVHATGWRCAGRGSPCRKLLGACWADRT